MIPSSRPKLSDLYTPSQSKLLENHTLHSSTYLYSPYMAVPFPGRKSTHGFAATEILAKGYQNYIPLPVNSSSLPVKHIITLLPSQSWVRVK